MVSWFLIGSSASARVSLQRYVRDCDEKYVLGVFIDLKSAFDHLNCNNILARLGKINCPEINLWTALWLEIVHKDPSVDYLYGTL